MQGERIMIAAHQSHVLPRMTYEGAGCNHIIAHNGTHCLILNGDARHPVAEWLNALELIFAAAPDYAYLYILTDVRKSDVAPMHLIAQMSSFLASHADSHIRSRIAFLHREEVMTGVAQSLARVVSLDSGHEIAFFTGDDVSTAVAWLGKL